MKSFKGLLVGAMLAVTSALPAFAVPVLDFTGVGTAITDEIAPAVTAGLPIAGTILGIYLGYKLFKRFVK
jgi:mannose/fructose/N-acetylgalactosamine-specific phosphotransferase system component IIC